MTNANAAAGHEVAAIRVSEFVVAGADVRMRQSRALDERPKQSRLRSRKGQRQDSEEKSKQSQHGW